MPRRTTRKRSGRRGRGPAVCVITILIAVGGLLWVNYEYPDIIPNFIDSLTDSTSAPITEAVVARVIDGDTIELVNGERVRFIGVDAPEIGEPGADEATEFVRELVEGHTVWLERDGNNTDRHGRLRRYIWLQYPTDSTDEY